MTWYNQTTGLTRNIFAVYFLADGLTGWCGGKADLNSENPVLAKTLDGGATWTQIDTSLLNLDIVAIRGISSSVFYVATLGYIYKTINGGATWTRSFGFSPIAGFDLSPSNQIVVMRANQVIDILDGNLTFIREADLGNNFMYSVKYIAVDTFIIAGYNMNNDNKSFAKSSDNGLTFTFANPSPNEYQITTMYSFINQNDGWASCVVYGFTDAAIYVTHDGGVTWTQQTNIDLYQGTTPPQNLDSIRMFDSLNGFCVDGTTGQVYVTSNGGAHWIADSIPESISPNYEPINSSINPNHIWIAKPDGNILANFQAFIVGGTITPSGQTPYYDASQPVYTITPNGGSSILDVKLDGVSVLADCVIVAGVATYTVPKINADRTLTASFQ